MSTTSCGRGGPAHKGEENGPRPSTDAALDSLAGMELTDTSAGLLAQVFPTLLIAILLEGRLSRKTNWSKSTLRGLMLLRVFAVFATVGATFLCMMVVLAGHSNAFINGWVACTFFILLAGTLALCAEVFERELMNMDEQPVGAPAAPDSPPGHVDKM